MNRQQTTSICDVKGKRACHGALIDVCRKLDFKVFYSATPVRCEGVSNCHTHNFVTTFLLFLTC